MGTGNRFTRWVGLLAIGAVALHELRYLMDSGAGHDALAGTHSYLPLVITLAMLAFVAALIDFATTLAVTSRHGLDLQRPSRVSRAWPAATLALLATFVLQESLEGALLGGHSAGLHGLFGHGGWSVAIFAPILGALIAFLLRGSDNALALAARRAPRARLKPVRVIPMRPPTFSAPRLRLLARHLAGRAPPVLPT
jgi:hypothetical protein